jgi:hypothetical protein
MASGIVASALFCSGTAVWACPQCRPGVEARVYNADFASNLLLLLPLLVLFLIGTALHSSDTIILGCASPKE